MVFAQHNVLKDAPFTKLDLIICRNLLIYFLPPAQKKVLSLFHFGLKTGGALFLGPSEGPGELADEFDTVNARWKVYRKRRDVRLPTEIRPPASHTIPLHPPAIERATSGTVHLDAPLTNVLDMLLEESLLPSILVNERRQIVRTFAGASQFLDLRDGWFSADVLDTVRPELRPILAGAVPRAMSESIPVSFKNLPIRLPEGDRVVDVRVKPLRAKKTGDQFALVTLEATEDGSIAIPEARELDLGEASRDHLFALETELRSVKESLQATIEELETSNEELQATNEELTASNEELQSTNEELHSVNEELYTVNGEYQKKIEELTELTTDMENLLDSTEVHTIFLDREMCVRKFTPRVAETFNLLPQDLGRRIDHFTYSLDHGGLLDDLRNVLSSETAIERQVRDRKGRWFLLRILPYRAGLGVEGVVLTLIDIGRVKQAETDVRRKDEQLAGILRHSPNWVFIKDLNGTYLLVDEAFKKFVGCDPVGKTVHDLFPAAVADQMRRQREEVLRLKAPVDAEVMIPNSDGPHTYLSIMFPILNEAGEMTALGGIRTDVTALKRAESDARAAVAQRDQFLAMLSHELRNPLAAIVNSTNVIARVGSQAPESALWFPVIERRAKHMARLIDDLLDVARVTQGKVQINREPIDLVSITPGVVEEIHAIFAERRIQLQVEPSTEPLPVIGDPARLQQVQVNLLMNAAKYTPANGRVWYSLRRDGNEAVIRVRDTGVGMTREMLQRSFDPFVQADETLARSNGGLGVGLTLVRSLIELHGGRVEARSEGPGMGSEFIVTIPLNYFSRESPREEIPNVVSIPETLRILVIEDDPDIRVSLEAMLQMEGYSVRSVGDAIDAISSIDAECPEVAIVDIGLPGMSGYDLARHIRRKSSPDQVKLIALTGYGQPLDRVAAQHAGFDHHLTKPANPATIETLLRKISVERTQSSSRGTST